MSRTAADRQKRKERIEKFIFWGVLISFAVPIAFLIVRIATLGGTESSEGGRSQADYVLMLAQCVLGVVAMFLPDILAKKLNLRIPSKFYMVYVIFLYCAIFLGEVRNFFYVVPHWDVILHGFSGVMLGAFGFVVVSILNRDEHVRMSLTPAFVAVFAFCFAVTLGVLWEVYEFTFDGLLGLNMQKFRLEDGTQLVGHAALRDTMKDLIVDCCGAGLATISGYFSLKNKKGWLAKVPENEETTAPGAATEKR